MTKEFMDSIITECVWLTEEHPNMHTFVEIVNDEDNNICYHIKEGFYNEIMDFYLDKHNKLSHDGAPYILLIDGKIMSSFDTNGLKWEVE